MRHGTPCTIRLLNALPINGVILYQLQLHTQGHKHQVALRYSALRAVANLLPRTEVKFPEPKHLASLFSQLTGDTNFCQERQRQLTHYFSSISSAPGLEQSIGFAFLLWEATHGSHPDGSGKQLTQLPQPPAAPKLMGKKLSAKIIEDEWC